MSMMKRSLISRAKFYIQRKWLESSFESQKYWELRYKNQWNSGYGSYGESSLVKAKIFNQILVDYNIRSVVEFGCGDGHQLSLYNIESYLGLDISETVIEQITKKYSEDSTKFFVKYDPKLFHINSKFIKTDACISVDVIFHLVEDEVFVRYMNHLFDLSSGFVIISATDFDDDQKHVAHVKNRKFTQWVKENKPQWKMIETRQAPQTSEQKFLDWVIYQKIPDSLNDQKNLDG